MAIKVGSRMEPKTADIESLYETASASVAAQTLLDAMGPQLERALAMRLNALFQAPAELGAVLDARAQLKAVYDLKEGLKNQMKKGQSAVDIFNKLLVESA
jgi:hypothetical protein